MKLPIKFCFNPVFKKESFPPNNIVEKLTSYVHGRGKMITKNNNIRAWAWRNIEAWHDVSILFRVFLRCNQISSDHEFLDSGIK